jgi:hypothetical protein
MNFRALEDWKASGLTRIHEPIQNAGPTASRRRFAHAAAGTAFAGAVGSRLWRPERTEAASFAPVPIPGGSPVLGGSYHVFGPGPAGIGIDPIDAEPSTITNLNGSVGLAYVSGMVTQTNTKTGETARYPFRDSDMRFMQGNFRGTDGRVHQGAFALV